MYELRRVDRAGNDHTVVTSENFNYLCGEMKMEQYYKPGFYYYIVNPDKVDIDCGDGLTEEERELVP